MLLGFRNGQIELARKGVDLVAEPSVVLESTLTLTLAHPAPTLPELFVTARSIAGPADA